MGEITLKQANAIVHACLAQGEALSLKPLSAAVLDPGGHLIAFQRGDGSPNLRAKIAIAKASGALALGMSSRKIGDMVMDRPAVVAALGGLSGGNIIPAAGGVIITDEAGAIVGAVGVTGDTSDNDEACAIAAVESVGLQVRA